MPSGSRFILGFVVFMLCIGIVFWLPELALTSGFMTELLSLGFIGLGLFAIVKVFF